jgi:4-amino-4-deoxy-L-arabinose transferase-like glycosyltransferase
MSDSRLAAFLFGLALLIRMVAWMGSALFGTDGCHYLLMADWFSAGRFHEALQIAYHPLYPLLIAVARIPLRDSVLAGHLVSILLGAAAVLPLFQMLRKYFGRPEAFIAAILYAFSPSLIEVHSDVMTEGTFMFFFFSAMALAGAMMEEPSLERAVVLGACAAAAYLTRPEGVLVVILGVAWQVVELLRRRDRPATRAGGLVLTVIVIAVAVAPYILWIKSVKGHWDLSMRPSVGSARKAVALLADPGAESAASNGFLGMLKAVYRMTYLVLIPFYLLGLAGLRKVSLRHALFYFSFPVCYLVGVLFTLRTHTFMSYRYVTAPMSLLMALPALGLVSVIRGSARRWPDARWRPAASGALLLLVGVLPCARWFNPSRLEILGFPVAARWIRAQGPPPRGLSGPAQQVAYLAGCPSRYSPVTPGDLRRQITLEPVDYYVYSEKDVAKRPQYVAMLRACELLEPPVEITGPPGSLKVFIQRVK